MRLIDFLSESIEDKGILKSVFLAGHPGSGKTYTMDKIKSGQIEPRIVNTDKMFPFFKDNWNEGWGKVRDKVKKITTNQLANNINSMLPLVIDGTSGNPSSLMRRRGILESFGYDTAMIWINTSLETAIKRASKRERQVDPEFIKEVYDKMQRMKEFYKTKFDHFVEINNDEGELTDDMILKAFKKMTGYFNTPVKNPIGQETIKEMREKKLKYLSPEIHTMDEIKKATSIWYKK